MSTIVLLESSVFARQQIVYIAYFHYLPDGIAYTLTSYTSLFPQDRK